MVFSSRGTQLTIHHTPAACACAVRRVMSNCQNYPDAPWSEEYGSAVSGLDKRKAPDIRRQCIFAGRQIFVAVVVDEKCPLQKKELFGPTYLDRQHSPKRKPLSVMGRTFRRRSAVFCVSEPQRVRTRDWTGRVPCVGQCGCGSPECCRNGRHESIKCAVSVMAWFLAWVVDLFCAGLNTLFLGISQSDFMDEDYNPRARNDWWCVWINVFMSIGVLLWRKRRQHIYAKWRLAAAVDAIYIRQFRVNDFLTPTRSKCANFVAGLQVGIVWRGTLHREKHTSSTNVTWNSGPSVVQDGETQQKINKSIAFLSAHFEIFHEASKFGIGNQWSGRLPVCNFDLVVLQRLLCGRLKCAFVIV